MILTDARFGPWLEQRIGVELARDAQFIGEIREGQVTGAIAFSHWTGHDMEVAVAGSKASRKLLQAFYEYCFTQHRCCRVTARIRASNKRSQHLAERLGFKREGTLRQGYGDEDALIYGLLRDDFPYGRIRRQATGSTGPEHDSRPPEPVQPL